MDRIVKKLKNNSGESIAELLISILISVLGITLLAIMIQTSSKLILNSKKKIEEYTEKENKIVIRDNSVKDETKHQANLKLSGATSGTPLYKDSGLLYAYVYNLLQKLFRQRQQLHYHLNL